MPAVYRRRPAAAAILFLGLAPLLLACEGRRPDPGSAELVRPRSSAFVTDAAFLRTRILTGVALDPSGGSALLAFAGRGLEALRWPPPVRRPLPLSGTILRFAPRGGEALLASGDPGRPFVRGRVTGEVAPLASPRESRFVGWNRMGDGFYAAVPSASTAGEDLLEVRWPAGGASLRFENPTPFAIGIASSDASLLALREVSGPETEQLFLYRRSDGETHLLLPSDSEGRFQPLRFSPDGSKLWLAIEVAGRRRELGHLDLSTGEVTVRSFSGCDFLELAGDAAIPRALATLSCDGRASAVALDLERDVELALPDPPAGTRWVGGDVASSGFLLVAAGAHSARDVYAWDGDRAGEVIPLTWLLDPAIEPQSLEAPRRLALGTGAPGELWSAARPGSGCAGVVWIEGDREAPAWEEFHPLFALLARRRVAVLRLRPRGSDGFGASLRHAADGVPMTAALADVAAARDVLSAACGAEAPVAVVGEGAEAAAIAVAALTDRDAPWRCGATLGLPDPGRPEAGLASPRADERAWWITRWGDPASPAFRRELEAARALERPQPRPLLLLADFDERAHPGLLESLATRQSAGEPISWRAERDAERGFAALSDDGKRTLLEQLERCLPAGR